MKAKLLLAALIVCGTMVEAASLRISGTVPDRGFNISYNQQQISTIKNTNLKIFVADKKSTGKSLKKLTGTYALSQASYVRVEAP